MGLPKLETELIEIANEVTRIFFTSRNGEHRGQRIAGELRKSISRKFRWTFDKRRGKTRKSYRRDCSEPLDDPWVRRDRLRRKGSDHAEQNIQPLDTVTTTPPDAHVLRRGLVAVA